MSDFICVKCLNPLGQVIVHSSQGPHHLVCPNPPNLKSDFERLLVNHLVIDTNESSEVVRYKVKHRIDAIIDAHNRLVKIVELHIKQELTMVRQEYAPSHPAPVKSPQSEVLDVAAEPLKDFCFNCNHLAHKDICNAPLEDDTFCACIATTEDSHGRRKRH